VPMPFFHTFLPLAPSFSFGACITVGLVKIFEGQVENNQENTSTSDQTNIKWLPLVLQAYPAEHVPSRMPLDFKIYTQYNVFLAYVYIGKIYISVLKTQYNILNKRCAWKLYMLLHTKKLFASNNFNCLAMRSDVLSISHHNLIVC